MTSGHLKSAPGDASYQNAIRAAEAALSDLRASDAAVARLCEAARELQENVPCANGCKSHGGDECTCGMERLCVAVAAALSDPALPGAAKVDEPKACGECEECLSHETGVPHTCAKYPSPPQPSGESAEAVAKRLKSIPVGSDFFDHAAKVIAADRAAQQARHAAEVAAKDREIADLKNTCDEYCRSESEDYLAQQSALAAKDAEIEKLTKSLKVAIEQRDDAQAEAFSLRTRLAAKGGT